MGLEGGQDIYLLARHQRALHCESRNQGKGMLEVPWLAVEPREWFASTRSTFQCRESWFNLRNFQSLPVVSLAATNQFSCKKIQPPKDDPLEGFYGGSLPSSLPAKFICFLFLFGRYEWKTVWNQPSGSGAVSLLQNKKSLSWAPELILR